MDFSDKVIVDQLEEANNTSGILVKVWAYMLVTMMMLLTH